jgi:hypothetical protein
MELSVFKVAFERWIAEKKPQGLATQVRPTLAALRAVSAERPGAERKREAAARERKPASWHSSRKVKRRAH